MSSFSITGLDHVQLAMPPGQEDVARAFYCGRLGLREVAKPAALAGRGGCWFAGAGVNLHLGVEEPFTPARKAHPALVVDDLEQARAALEGGEVSSLPGWRRFYIADPFGNRIEVMQPHQDRLLV
ncbi:VOC family protein [Yoonia sp. R2331]|uniref:VOC family protein n=1 Tax=Yoonia sp. R2331 TaxID=3237238 RepID=UPI0034E4E84D